MRPRFLLLLVFVVCTGAAAAREEARLLHQAKAGQAITYRHEGAFSFEVAGTKVSVEMKMLERHKIAAVAANGDITREIKIEEAEATINGEKMPAPDSVLKMTRTTVIRPDGTLVSSKLEGGDSDDRSEQNRLDQAARVVFAAKPVTVGDRWSHEFKEDDAKGSVPAVAEYEVAAFETVKGVPAVKLKTHYRESSGERKMTVTGEVWVERSSGDTVQGEFKIENLPFGSGGGQIPPINGTLRVERTSGGPMGGASADQPASAPEKKKDKTIEEVTKEAEKLQGLFTLYRKKESGRESLYLEVREDQLDRLLLLQATASTGAASMFLAAGNPLDDILFKLVKRDEQILFVVPNTKYRADEKKPIARAARRSFPDAFLDAFKIEARSEERKSLLINVTDLFRSDIAQLTQTAVVAGGGMYSIDRDKTNFSAIKVFPANLLVQTAYHLSRAGGGMGGGGLSIPGLSTGGSLADSRSLPVVVNYNLSFLPGEGYRPRLSDPRVGYFVADTQDFTDDRDEQTRRYILRWRIEKADPNAALSPPKEPILFWLDNAIPEEYRDAVRRGILLWNKAFECVGIKDAIVVKQMPDDADWDHADMRYNVIRWVTSPGNGYAVALFRINPLTGQILNAGITVDANMTRFTKMEFKRMVDPLSALQAAAPDAANPYRCSYAEEALPQAWFGYTAMSLLAGPSSTKTTEKQFIDDFLTETVAHEMGHILGLRHNFIASTLRSLKELEGDPGLNTGGMVGSVMDYNPFNLAALHSPESRFWPTTIGPYDYWAIQYGYATIAATSPDGERAGLNAIACRCNEPGHAYQSDEVADQFDPLVTRFDLGKDPLDYWSLMFRDLNSLMTVVPSRYPQKGESYYQFTRTFNGMLSQYGRAAMVVSRYIGGLHLSGNHRGDPGEKPPLAPIPASEQRRALALLRRYIFARDAFNFPKGTLQKLAPNPYPDLLSVLIGGQRQDAPVRDTISGLQQAALTQLLSPQTLNRMANNEFKVSDPKATLGLAALFDALATTIWEEVPAATPVSSLRRQLQRAHLMMLRDMVVRPAAGTPDDAKMLARFHLRRLKLGLASAQGRVRDEYTRIHYAEAIDLINQALDAKMMLGAPAQPSAGTIIIR
jgi:hypothetical protein